MNNTVKTTILGLFIAFGVLFTIPSQAHAIDFNPFNPLDPFCLFSDCNDDAQTVDNSINNSYNGNTNSFNTVNQTNGGSGAVNTTPYTPIAPSSVYASTPAATVNNNYNYNTNSGGGTAYIPASTIYYPSNPTYVYPQYSVYDLPPTLPYRRDYPLSVSCSANTTYINTNSYVSWSAYASGGNGYYTYSWSGTDGLYGNSSFINKYYSTPGVKSAYVTVYSNGYSSTAYCSNSVTVGGTYYYSNPVYVQPAVYNPTIQVACAADTTSTRVGVPVTWVAEAVMNGYAGNNFTYSWNGNGGLYGSQSSAVANYSTPGTKTATVTVTAPNGQNRSVACRNSVVVKNPATTVVAKPAPVKPAPQIVYVPVPTPTPEVTPLFSLNNVPWGWVAVLTILVLMGIVFYLVFNKKKI